MTEIAATKGPLEILQEKFCLIDLSGELRVVHQQLQGHIVNNNTEPTSFYKRSEALVLMKRELETLPFPCDRKIVIEQFYNSPKTRCYRKTAFSPEPQPDDVLNFWVNPIAKNDSGDSSQIVNFIKEVICQNDQHSYDYLVRFLAHMIQKPTEKPGVMVVLLGPQGTGKGVFFSLLHAIWSSSTLLVNDAQQVIGNFNSIIERNFVLCMDEALFAGDKKALDRLKSMITERYVSIEQKYQPRRTIESCHRFFAASNHDHFANVEVSDRRFLFLRVSESRKQDFEYFRTLTDAINDPIKIGAFVHHLETTDISNFHIRAKPNTKEHAEQVLKSLDGVDRYWFEVLVRGQLSPGIHCFDKKNWEDPIFISSDELVRAYTDYNKSAERFQPIQSKHIKLRILKLCPSAKSARPTIGKNGMGQQQQARGIQLPSLATARSNLEKYLGFKISWE